MCPQNPQTFNKQISFVEFIKVKITASIAENSVRIYLLI